MAVMVSAKPEGRATASLDRRTLAVRPIVLIAFAGFVPLLLATRVSPANFVSLWRAPKYLGGSDTLIILGLVATVAIGCLIGSKSDPRVNLAVPIGEEMLARAGIAARRLLAIGFLAYAVLIVMALVRGLQPSLIAAALGGQRGAITQLKVILRPVGGVTTFNQLVGPGVALAVFYRIRAREWFENSRGLVLAGIALSLGRAMLYAERLAFLEIAVPLAITLVLTRQPPADDGAVAVAPLPTDERRHARWRTTALPAVLAVLVAGLYPLQEYYRKWLPYYSHVYKGSFWPYVLDRLTGYYATAINNSVMAHRVIDVPLGAVVLRPLRELPFLGGMGIPGHGFDFNVALASYGNPEFNNIGGVSAVFADIGMFAIPLLFISGILIGKVFARAASGDTPMVVVYGTVVVGLLEMSRIPYFLVPRGIMPVAGALIAARWIMRPPDTMVRTLPARVYPR